jgi:hypothetical protein
VRAIVGALEDARVEWLACRELPGLRRLWLRFHVLEAPSALPGIEELLRRLARVLLDPAHADPHPWVAKGRSLFFADADGQVLALHRPEALRIAATRLGHDLGQMRLRFDARQYRVAPAYRDDHSGLWQQDPAQDDTPHDIDAGAPQLGPGTTGEPAPPAQCHVHPEWDRSVPLLRPRWCTVLDAPAAESPHAGAIPPIRRRRAAPALRQQRRQRDGPAFDLDALIDAQVSLRRGGTPSQALYLRRRQAASAGATLLLIDSSASTARPVFDGTGSLLDAARQLAWQAAARWPRCAIHASCSDGRHAVHYLRIKDFDQPLDAACWRRLTGLQSRLSTRLGAALRHAAWHLASGPRPGAPGRLLLITDGRPQDIDVHDPRYLSEDARHAVHEAARSGVKAQCLSLDAAMRKPLQRIFGAGQVQWLTRPAALDRALAWMDAALD